MLQPFSSAPDASTPPIKAPGPVVDSDERSRPDERVLVYGMNYAPEIAGVGRYTGEIAEHIAARGAQVSVITTPAHYPGWRIQESFTNARYVIESRSGVRVLRCPLILRERMDGVWRLLAPLSFALTSAPVAIWHVMRRRPHIIICVEPTLFVAPVALLLARLVGARALLHVQDLEVDAAFAVGHLAQRRWLKYLGAKFERHTLRRFDRIITISDRMAERLTHKGVSADHVAVVRNWVDLDHIYPLGRPSLYREKLDYAQDDFVVLYSGNIGPKQGLGVLLEAARLLAAEPRVKFVIAGEGPTKSELTKAFGDLPSTRFLSFQPYEQLNEFLNLADLHVLPQDAGAADLVLPSKIAGMLASGKPVLVTADADSELAVFLSDAAIMSPPGDPVALAAAIRNAKAQDVDIHAKQRLALSERLSKTDGLNLFCECIGVADKRRSEFC